MRVIAGLTAAAKIMTQQRPRIETSLRRMRRVMGGIEERMRPQTFRLSSFEVVREQITAGNSSTPDLLGVKLGYEERVGCPPFLRAEP